MDTLENDINSLCVGNLDHTKAYSRDNVNIRNICMLILVWWRFFKLFSSCLKCLEVILKRISTWVKTILYYPMSTLHCCIKTEKLHIKNWSNTIIFYQTNVLPGIICKLWNLKETDEIKVPFLKCTDSLRGFLLYFLACKKWKIDIWLLPS